MCIFLVQEKRNRKKKCLRSVKRKMYVRWRINHDGTRLAFDLTCIASMSPTSHAKHILCCYLKHFCYIRTCKYLLSPCDTHEKFSRSRYVISFIRHYNYLLFLVLEHCYEGTVCGDNLAENCVQMQNNLDISWFICSGKWESL